jgi:hypothetical protein
MEQLRADEKSALEDHSISEQVLNDVLARNQLLMDEVNNMKQECKDLPCEDTGFNTQPYIDALQALDNWLIQNDSNLNAAKKVLVIGGRSGAAESMLYEAWPILERWYDEASAKYNAAIETPLEPPN